MLRTMVRISPAFLLWPFVPARLFEFHAWAFPLHVVLRADDPFKNVLRPIRQPLDPRLDPNFHVVYAHLPSRESKRVLNVAVNVHPSRRLADRTPRTVS
jgi:hypothetical protein